MFYPSLLRAAFLSFALALAACGSSEDDDAKRAQPRAKTISGTLNYTENIPLAPESTVKVQLLDVSNADRSATVIAETVIHKPGKSPFPFQLEFDADEIEPGRDYSLRAEVMEQTRLMFVSESSYRVVGEESKQPVEIMLKYVPGGRMERMAEYVRANNPTLSGHYRYYDGEGEFTDCSDDVSHPLARVRGIYGLESAYRNVAPRFGDEVFVRLAGKYVTRPARDGRGKEDYLIVLQVEEMDADGDCP